MEKEQGNIEPLRYQLKQWRLLVAEFLPPTNDDRNDTEAIRATIKQQAEEIERLRECFSAIANDCYLWPQNRDDQDEYTPAEFSVDVLMGCERLLGDSHD